MDPYSVRFFSSVFSSHEMERSFRSLHHNPENLRITSVFAVLVYCSYILLDSFLFPGYFRIFLIIRAGIFLPVSLVMIFPTYTRIFRYFSSSIIISIAAAGAGGIITIEYLQLLSIQPGTDLEELLQKNTNMDIRKNILNSISDIIYTQLPPSKKTCQLKQLGI